MGELSELWLTQGDCDGNPNGKHQSKQNQVVLRSWLAYDPKSGYASQKDKGGCKRGKDDCCYHSLHSTFQAHLACYCSDGGTEFQSWQRRSTVRTWYA